MCGIVGIYQFHSSQNDTVDYDVLTEMRDAMVHRGPDAKGIWISDDRKVGLAHRRLSIIDLSPSANQPMSNEDGEIQVVYNGEIYNHDEIRKELINIGGHKWKTGHSDTEVIIHAYEEWGIKCIQRFRGMFAIAIWDGRRRQLYLIRDRIGIKPLYWTVGDGRICFASEIKAILKDKRISRSIDEEALYHYLSFLTTPAPHTLFKGIKKIPAGYLLRIDADGQIKKECWWQVFDNDTSIRRYSEEDAVEQIKTMLSEAVRLRMISDVPVGVLLSGGIDSSTNAALFSRYSDRKVKTFTVGYKDATSYNNEYAYARRMAKEIGSEHHEIELSIKDIIAFLPKLIHHQDEPIADPVCIPIYYVSKLAKDNGVTVVQVGEGSDELFFGYPKWRWALQFQKLNQRRMPVMIKKMILLSLGLLGKKDKLYYEWMRRGIKKERIFWGGAEAFSEPSKKSILSQRMQNMYRDRSSYEVIDQLYRQYRADSQVNSDLNWMSYVDLRLRLPELLLMRVDKMSMAVSIEARVPFLDHRLVELALSLDDNLKIKNRELKYILKKSVEGVIPDDLIYRKKQGFDVPVAEWMLKELGEVGRDCLKSFCKSTDILDYKNTLALVNSGSRKAWYLMNLALWWEYYIKSNQ